MKPKSLVETKIDKSAYCNPDFFDLTGGPTPDKIYYGYAGKDYYYIAGSIGWPPDFSGQPGCVLIVGVTREDIPSYEVLDAVFENSPRQLLNQCLILRDKFGFRDSSRLFSHWIGDASRFVTVEENFNQANKEAPRHGIFTNSPPDFDRPNADELYIDTLRSLSAEGRVIIPAQFHEVKDSLQGMTLADTTLADFPSAAALGYALYEMETVKPWLNTVRAFTMDDGIGY